MTICMSQLSFNFPQKGQAITNCNFVSNYYNLANLYSHQNIEKAQQKWQSTGVIRNDIPQKFNAYLPEITFGLELAQQSYSPYMAFIIFTYYFCRGPSAVYGMQCRIQTHGKNIFAKEDVFGCSSLSQSGIQWVRPLFYHFKDKLSSLYFQVTNKVRSPKLLPEVYSIGV